MIFNGIKRRWLRKEIQKLQERKRKSPVKWPDSLVVICDGRQDVDLNLFYEWARQIGIKKEAVSVLVYVTDRNKSTIEDTFLIDRKLIKWSGGITDSEIKQLLEKSFDLQINFFDQQNELLEFVSLSMLSKLKVAYTSNQSVDFDLAIDVPLSKHKEFIKELLKYLKILTS